MYGQRLRKRKEKSEMNLLFEYLRRDFVFMLNQIKLIHLLECIPLGNLAEKHCPLFLFI